MRNKRDWRAGQEKRMRKLPTELSAQWHQIGGWLHNTPMFIDPSSIRTSVARTYTRLYTCALVYKSVHTWSQQPNVTPNLRQRMLHRSMCIRRWENAIELSRILFECRATSTSRADDNPQGRRFRWSNQWGRNKSSRKYSRFSSKRE